MELTLPKPTNAFIGASWSALLVGTTSYFVGLWNASFGLGEKGFYVVLMLFGLFSVISLQKAVRDRHEGIPVTGIYYGLAWTAVLTALMLMIIGLWNATFGLSEKGFYGMAYTLSLFAATTIQKNVRDTDAINKLEDEGLLSSSGEDKPWYRSARRSGSAEEA